MGEIRNTADNLMSRMNETANIIGDRKDGIISWLGDFKRLVEDIEKVEEENRKLVEENKKLVEQSKKLQEELAKKES
ncbi:MAG: hypothetical protein COZ28_02265 [Candidatus Moranbacteria bacterium CG_4_10_14_3_um_filter_44_15]|nr:MAG: hypothetical protein COS72_02235 [Candidatus Moranbacteria bacterium CG06_land_8_20_14_3_00_43_56]PIV84457.1 MAG: hypothetical protein COW51_00400 [Candidatus Moranbacteria bacterium CG17_big_fil_post_rev_8_21_14_2_50_44_12]PIW92861.1 MAG: hypothetical protein COZ87_04360 [Candidatus Moranbacteria bacterium CG_4_8_14_3_um_filter_43_15]PIX90718.1 MAG: hypothetical protein COZ28_02265 [Candidatus Moranbacteria bacterium CG_4_10_14_3_um_filter_44_15]PJA86150.1 MAG: hypothetical protein CO1